MKDIIDILRKLNKEAREDSLGILSIELTTLWDSSIKIHLREETFKNLFGDICKKEYLKRINKNKLSVQPYPEIEIIALEDV